MTAGTRSRLAAEVPPARVSTHPSGPRRTRHERRPSRLRGPAWVEGPMTSCHLVLGAAGLLLTIGLVMVFSASSIEAALADEPAWKPGVQQLIWALIGLGAMLVALRLPVGFLRRWSPIALLVVVGMLLLVLVPGIGLKLNGARQWFNLGFANLQPSEIAKLVFALWGAHVLALRERYLTTKSLLVPVLPVFGVLSLLLIAEPDFGAVVSLGLVLVGLLWAGGMPLRYFGWFVVAAAAALRADDQARALPDGADHLVPRPLLRSHRRRVPGDPGHVRARHRRPLGRGPGQQRDEVEPAAARPVGLHLRDHRRGARLPRLPRRRHPVRRARLRGLPHRPALGRPVRPARLRRDHRLAHRPGRDEHGLRGRPAAGDRRPVAADLRGRHVAGADAVHRRPARPVRPRRARGRRGAARPDARTPGPDLPAGPGVRRRPRAPAPPSGGAARRPARWCSGRPHAVRLRAARRAASGGPRARAPPRTVPADPATGRPRPAGTSPSGAAGRPRRPGRPR